MPPESSQYNLVSDPESNQNRWFPLGNTDFRHTAQINSGWNKWFIYSDWPYLYELYIQIDFIFPKCPKSSNMLYLFVNINI